MRRGKRMGRSKSRRVFRSNAMRVNPRNLPRSIQRGGIRM